MSRGKANHINVIITENKNKLESGYKLMWNITTLLLNNGECCNEQSYERFILLIERKC